MKVLVIGGGGREHAIAWKLSKSPRLTKLFCAPGNPGTQDLATNLALGFDDPEALAQWALAEKIDLAIVGPEAPLAAGIVDIFTGYGIRIFGPTKAAAQLEASKSFAKVIMQDSGVPTAHAEIFEDSQLACEYVRRHKGPIVVKADGLAAGKGVVVAANTEDAIEAIEWCLLDQGFGTSGSRVVVEDFIRGSEASVIAIIDGRTVLPLVVSQDYKRLSDNDAGPNTGGMGAISPTPVFADENVNQLVTSIFTPVLLELERRGIRYRGFLYAGLMVDETGKHHVLEFNCRLGDPETQVLLLRLESDLLDVLDKAVEGTLDSVKLAWSSKAAACVVASSRGYPENVDDGKHLEGLFPAEEGLVVFHAGTRLDPSDPKRVLTKGGRVLAVSALGETVAVATARAYEGLHKLHFEGMHYRKDIGKTKTT